jgi:5-methylcytosine-specific restriction protein B
MFSWIPLHKETAVRLLSYETKQAELIAILADMEKRGLNSVPLNDRPTENTQAQVTVMDPFTFFAVFNRHLTFQNRLRNWRDLKERWNLKSPIPQDFHGIPTLTPQNAWFFPYLFRREPDDVACLWKLARAIVEKGWGGVSAELFERCLAIRTIGVGKLTTGLFWLAPTACLPLVSTTVEYLKAKKLWTDVTDKASLDTVMDGVRRQLSAI